MSKLLLILGFVPLATVLFGEKGGDAPATTKVSGPPLHVASTTVLVKNQDEALRWYTTALGFEKRADDAGTMPGFRWLTVGPVGQPDFEIVLLPADEKQMSRVGQGTQIVVTTKDCKAAFELLSSRGVKFAGGVEAMPWGTTANFTDLYGNPFHLLEAKGR